MGVQELWMTLVSFIMIPLGILVVLALQNSKAANRPLKLRKLN